uniref:AlNc14C46G3749 protein n=1 Tax=Albugo laibachii Nc14 TaxID=890382 RepID=F0WAN5_9STRA|nr:AlNc14C46G3749 [Albugo laibachii Nc14]|eukprot:CCA18206.1 AlNc14C46G3749 [Albugo laibachii Nc14]
MSCCCWTTSPLIAFLRRARTSRGKCCPPTTSFLQSFKSKLKLMTPYIVGKFDELLDKAAEVGYENLETQMESLYTLDVLQAMQWAQEAWEIVMCTTVANCWRRTKTIYDDLYKLVESMKQLALGQ